MQTRQVKDIINLTRTTTQQNYFEYNSNYYSQENGLPMGSPLSGLLADIYIHNLEINKIQNHINPFKDNIIYWFRYVDDIICLFKGNEIEGMQFLAYLNSISNSIKFTMESHTEKIEYLD